MIKNSAFKLDKWDNQSLNSDTLHTCPCHFNVYFNNRLEIVLLQFKSWLH
jgi:hypothetical protein